VSDLERLLGLLRAEDLEDTPQQELGGALEAPLSGALIGERFEVREVLGRGGMGAVVRAFDRQVQREVALKFLVGSATPARVARLRREATLAARIDSPHVVCVHSLEESSGRVFLVTEYVRGARSLRAAWESLSTPQRLDLLEQVGAGVAAAHVAGVIHRDIKPENVLVGSDGRARLADFGVARAEGVDRLTATGASVGTLRYMAPEQAAGESVDESADVWALGVLLFLALHGRLPFEEETITALLAALFRPVDLDPGLPTRLAAVCRRALHPEPARRFSSAGAFVDALRAARARPTGGGRAALGWLAASLCLAVGTLGWLAGRDQVLDAPPPPASDRLAVAPSSPVAKGGEFRLTERVRYMSLLGDDLYLELERGVERWDPVRGRRLERWTGGETLTMRNQGRPASPGDVFAAKESVGAWGPRGLLGARLESGRVVVHGPAGQEQRTFDLDPMQTSFAQPFVTARHVILVRSGVTRLDVQIWSREGWAPVVLEGADESWIAIRSAAVSPSGLRLALGGVEGFLVVWRLDVAGGPTVLSVADTQGPMAGVAAVAHSKTVSVLAFRDEQHLLSASPQAGELALWDLARAARVDHRDASCLAVAVQPDHARAAFAFAAPRRVKVVPWQDPSSLPDW
jgi:hypothetical protein